MKKKPLTPRAVEKYITANGTHCLFCGKKSISGYGMMLSMNNGMPYQEVKCYGCGKIWRENFAVISILYEGEEYLPPSDIAGVQEE